MSASLVGSEMCIRDRKSAPGATRSGRLHPSWSEGTHGPSKAPGPGPKRCLLYTSDAADDM
eukprot:3132924-Alexandrium_andersonii.AAC.1